MVSGGSVYCVLSVTILTMLLLLINISYTYEAVLCVYIILYTPLNIPQIIHHIPVNPYLVPTRLTIRYHIPYTLQNTYIYIYIHIQIYIYIYTLYGTCDIVHCIWIGFLCIMYYTVLSLYIYTHMNMYTYIYIYIHISSDRESVIEIVECMACVHTGRHVYVWILYAACVSHRELNTTMCMEIDCICEVVRH